MAEPHTTSSGTAILWNLDPSEAFRVIKASALLAPSMKLLWMEDHLLSRRDPTRGSFIIAEKMGKRLRLSTSTVEQIRRGFLSLELYLKKKGNGRGDSWMPCLPAECVPGRGESSDEAFLEHADRLDAHIRRRAAVLPPSFFYVLDYMNLTHGTPRDRPTEPHGTDPPDTVEQTHGTPGGKRASRRSLVSQEGGKGGVPSQQVLKEPSLLNPSSRRRESSFELSEKGDVERGDGGPGEGDSTADARRAAMDELRQRLDAGSTQGGTAA